MRLTAIVAACALAAVMAPQAVVAQEYPERPITVIIPFAPGGGADITARTLFPYVARHLPGATFVMLNRAGGGGEVGFTEIALAAPDGYTIGAINTPSVVMKPIEHEARYTREDFTYVANIAFDPSAVAVRSDSPFETLEDLIEALTENPGSLVAGTAGVGSEDHLLLARLSTLTGTEIRLAPFGSSGEAMIALKGGHIDMTVVNSASSASEVATGDIRVLALASTERWDHLPDVPTFEELGIPLIGGSARGYGGPAGIPEDIAAALEAAIAAALEDPEFLVVAEEQRLPLRYMDSETYRAFVEEQHEALADQWDVDPWID